MNNGMYIPGLFPGMNEIIASAKNHPKSYSRMKKRHTARVEEAALIYKLQPVKKADFQFVWVEKHKRRDPDNIAAGGRKFIFDGLVKAGVLKDDGWNQIGKWEDVFVTVNELSDHDKEMVQGHTGVFVRIDPVKG